MSESLFRVIFISDLIEESNRDVVKSNLANLFGTAADKVDRLFTPSPVILKKELSRDEAVRYRDAIVRCGAFCRIESMDSVPEVLVTLNEELPDTTMVCPRCETEQAKSALCRSCGAIIEQYRARTAEMPSPEVAIAGMEVEEDSDRRYLERRQDLESSVNVTDDSERRNGRDRRRTHMKWRI